MKDILEVVITLLQIAFLIAVIIVVAWIVITLVINIIRSILNAKGKKANGVYKKETHDALMKHINEEIKKTRGNKGLTEKEKQALEIGVDEFNTVIKHTQLQAGDLKKGWHPFQITIKNSFKDAPVKIKIKLPKEEIKCIAKSLYGDALENNMDNKETNGAELSDALYNLVYDDKKWTKLEKDLDDCLNEYDVFVLNEPLEKGQEVDFSTSLIRTSLIPKDVYFGISVGMKNAEERPREDWYYISKLCLCRAAYDDVMDVINEQFTEDEIEKIKKYITEDIIEYAEILLSRRKKA